MSISGTVKFSGRLGYSPPVPSLDNSMNPSWLADVLEQMPCAGRKEEEYTLTVDGDTVVNFGSLASASAVVIKVQPDSGTPSPITAKLTSTAGVDQAISIDGFMILFSQSVPYTALSIARPTGVQVTVRVLLFSLGS